MASTSVERAPVEERLGPVPPATVWVCQPVRSAEALGDELLALDLVQATPDAVRFPDSDCVIETWLTNGTSRTDGLGSCLSCLLLVLALEMRGREEDRG